MTTHLFDLGFTALWLGHNLYLRKLDFHVKLRNEVTWIFILFIDVIPVETMLSTPFPIVRVPNTC